MQGKYVYGLQSWYPHLKPNDVHLWEKFIRANANFFDTVDYDVAVGEGVVVGDVTADVYAKSFKKLTQKKIDVIGYRKDQVWIVEVKPFAGSSALGQLLSYRILFDDETLEGETVHLMIITNECRTEYKKIFESHNIRVEEVGICPYCAGALSV